MARPLLADDAATAPEARPPLLGRLNARGFRLIMAADLVVLAGAFVLPMVVRHGLAWPTYAPGAYAAGYLAAVALHFAALYFTGLYERAPRLGAGPSLPRIVTAVVVALLIIALIELLTGVFLVPRGNLPAVLGLAVVGLAADRALAERLRWRREGPPRVLLVGGPDDVDPAREHLQATGEPVEIVGAQLEVDGLLAAVERTGATDVLLVSPSGLEQLYPEPLTTLEQRGAGVLQRVSARDTLLGLQSVVEVGGMPFTRLRTQALPPSRLRAKRLLELAILLPLAPVALVVFAASALWVLGVDGRPVLYHQERVGRHGEVFSMAKLRTMRRDAEQQGEPVLAAGRRDPRVLRGCGWLRATRVDEIPQLWHVLRGEMSLVGPRPERPELTARFEELIPGYARRHEVPPGITGLAQIHGRYHTDASYKLGYDLQYLLNWSLVLDLQILLRTAWVVLARRV